MDGYLRLQAAMALKLEKVPVVYADDLTDAQVKAFRILANKSANWASWDDELLKLEFEELRDMDFDLELTDFDLDEINEDYLDLSNSETLSDNFEEICEPDSSKEPISKLGDLWILGNHQVLCGDSTNAEVFQRILDGSTADLAVTDPPYNLNYSQDGKRILDDN